MDSRNGHSFLISRVNDIVGATEKHSRPHYIGFLDAAQRAVCEAYLRMNHVKGAVFYGGYDGAERKMLGIFPRWMDICYDEFPLRPITVRYSLERRLTHRDFLGTLISLGIERKSIGDILCSDGYAVIFLHTGVFEYVCSQTQKIGGVGVKIQQGAKDPLPVHKNFLDIRTTVSSLRLDCVVKALSGLGREKSGYIIKSGMVFVNSVANTTLSTKIKSSDILSIRGYGKYIIEDVNNVSKKGRIILFAKKYI